MAGKPFYPNQVTDDIVQLIIEHYDKLQSLPINMSGTIRNFKKPIKLSGEGLIINKFTIEHYVKGSLCRVDVPRELTSNAYKYFTADIELSRSTLIIALKKLRDEHNKYIDEKNDQYIAENIARKKKEFRLVIDVFVQEQGLYYLLQKYNEIPPLIVWIIRILNGDLCDIGALFKCQVTREAAASNISYEKFLKRWITNKNM
eukprot:507576_1